MSKVFRALAVAAIGATAWSPPAHASWLSGEALDTMANAIAWFALIVVPIVVIGVFWLLHILPEKIAEKRRHPQAKAIQALCILSLFFGGMLWPLAWLWAYTKPVLHKLAYGTDVDDAHGQDEAPPASDAKPSPAAPDEVDADEIASLRRQVAALEMQLAAAQSAPRGSDA